MANSGAGERLANPLHRDTRLHDLLNDNRHTILLIGDDDEKLRSELSATGLSCVRVAADAAADFVDADQDLAGSLGGARLALVRPDRIVALSC